MLIRQVAALLFASALSVTAPSSARSAFAQAPSSATTVFEVASIKPNTTGGGQSVRLAPGATSMVNVTLRTLILTARDIPASRILNGPNWITGERFDVLAKADTSASREQLRLMLWALLEERFRLMTHTEAREETTFALVHARGDRRLGANLRPASLDCSTPGGRQQLGAPGPTHPCNQGMGVGKMSGRGMPLTFLAGQLSTAAGRTVLDKTAMIGNFDWEIVFTPQVLQAPADRERLPQADPNGASIFTAVQEQLGLKLESQRENVEVLVIDSVDRPTPD